MSSAEIFRRAMRAPLDVADELLAALPDDERELVALRIGAELELIDSVILGRQRPTRLSADRMKELMAAAARPGFSWLDIPIAEWRVLCANGEQLDALLAVENDS